jgi:hypothetical protein
MASIGSIFVDFVARTAGFNQGCRDAAAQAKTSGKDIQGSFKDSSSSASAMAEAVQRGGLKVGVSLMGARSVAMLVVNELKDIAHNINDIPGVPQSTIDSINRMNYSLETSNMGVKAAGARALGWFNDFGEGIGYITGEALYGVNATREAFDKMNKEAAEFAKLPFENSMAKIQESINALESTRGAKFDHLKDEADLLRALAAGVPIPKELGDVHPYVVQRQREIEVRGGMTEGARQSLETEASQKQMEAEQGILELRKMSNDQMERYSSEVEKAHLVGEGIGSQLTFWNAKLDEATASMREGFAELKEGDNPGTALEQMEKAYKKMAEAQAHINQLNEKLKEGAKMLRDTFTNAFSQISDNMAEMVLKGKTDMTGFVNMIAQQILSMVIKLSIINPILNGMFGGFSGFSALPTMFGGGKAVGGDVDQGTAYLVGEKGPELFMPGSSGTIVPNHVTSRLTQGGAQGPSIHQTFYIQPGVSHAELMPLLRQFGEQQKASIMDDVSRGGRKAMMYGAA